MFVALAAIAGACTLTLPDEADFFGRTPDAGSDGGATDGSNGVDATAELDAGDADVDIDAEPELEPAELLLHYDFDDISTGTVHDVSTHGLHATLKSLDGGVLPASDPVGKVGKGVILDDAHQQYIELPPSILVGVNSMSVTCWLNLKKGAVWDRLFDFNASTTVWMYFSPTGWNFDSGAPGTHFAISSSSRLDPEIQLDETFPVDGNWHHVAVVVAPPYFFYYLDGVEKARRTTMKIHPRDLGVTDKNWIGRSAHAIDPYLSGRIDEFKIFTGGLTAAQVAAEASGN